jgi:hypothetical protein
MSAYRLQGPLPGRRPASRCHAVLEALANGPPAPAESTARLLTPEHRGTRWAVPPPPTTVRAAPGARYSRATHSRAGRAQSGCPPLDRSRFCSSPRESRATCQPSFHRGAYSAAFPHGRSWRLPLGQGDLTELLSSTSSIVSISRSPTYFFQNFRSPACETTN